MEGDESRVEKCDNCQSTVGFSKSDDGFFYCNLCGARAPDLFDSLVDDQEINDTYSSMLSRQRHVIRPSQPLSQVKPVAPTPSQYFDHPNTVLFKEEIEEKPIIDVDVDTVGPINPSDFGSYSQDAKTDSAIRLRYLCGIQVMIQLQCRALVSKYNVSPLIVGLVGPIFLRLLASTGVMKDDWASKAITDFETQSQVLIEDIYSPRLAMVLYSSISNVIPKFYSLAITFLACHVAREPILPTDILKWTLQEENVPYFSAFIEIEKILGPNISSACPISASRMFRPIKAISAQKLESTAANIAKMIGLDLPQVNFYAIASRYCTKLSLPTEQIIPTACRIWEWSMPPELYLSSNELRIPTRAYVMSILIVAIRVLFDINGYGIWESSLSSPSSVSNNEETKPRVIESDTQDTKLNAVELLQILEAKYKELDDKYDYSNDLPSYLKHCKDVHCSGLEPQEPEEIKIITELWDFYNKFKETANEESKNKRSKYVIDGNGDNDAKEDECCGKERAIRKMKLDMEENKFCYIKPRSVVRNKDYIHYVWKREEVLVYAVHADYYILLRSCAKVAQVETRILHNAVLRFEKRLKWLEKKIDKALHNKVDDNDVCDFCCDGNT